MEDLYEHLLNTELAIIESLKPGKKLSDAFEEGVRFFKVTKHDFTIQ